MQGRRSVCFGDSETDFPFPPSGGERSFTFWRLCWPLFPIFPPRFNGRTFSGGAGQLHVREVRIAEAKGARNVLLVHGGGRGGVASFDVPVRGYSLAEDLARNGFRVFVMDVRGWGSSTRPREMDQPPNRSSPLVSTKEAADDIATAVNWIVDRTHHKVAVMGWARAGTGHAHMRPANREISATSSC